MPQRTATRCWLSFGEAAESEAVATGSSMYFGRRAEIRPPVDGGEAVDDPSLAALLERLATHHRKMIGLHRQLTTPVLLTLAVLVDTVRSWVDANPPNDSSPH